MDNGKLNFRNIPVDDDLNKIKESSLARKSYRDVRVKNPKLWEYGQERKPSFTKYLEEVIPVDYHQDADEYADTLDFSKRGIEPTFTFEDIRNTQERAAISKEETEDLDVYEEVNHIVQDAFADYLEEHYDLVKDYLRNSKFNIENLSADFFNGICSSVASDILMNRDIAEHVENLYEPGYFDDVFLQYITNAASIEEKNNPKAINTLEEATIRSTLNDAMGFVVVRHPEGETGLGRNKQGKLEGPFLAVDTDSDSGYDPYYKWVRDIEDAELFKTEKEAKDALILHLYEMGAEEDEEGDYTDFFYNELLPAYEKEHRVKVEDPYVYVEDRDENLYNNSLYCWFYQNCKVADVFYSDLMTSPSTLKESRIGDVEILLAEFDKRYPEGSPKRDEYALTQYLMKCLGVDKDCAYEIASQYLEKGYFTY